MINVGKIVTSPRSPCPNRRACSAFKTSFSTSTAVSPIHFLIFSSGKPENMKILKSRNVKKKDMKTSVMSLTERFHNTLCTFCAILLLLHWTPDVKVSHIVPRWDSHQTQDLLFSFATLWTHNCLKFSKTMSFPSYPSPKSCSGSGAQYLPRFIHWDLHWLLETYSLGQNHLIIIFTLRLTLVAYNLIIIFTINKSNIFIDKF